MTLEELNKLRPARLRALTGMSVKALGELLTSALPELVRRRTLAFQRPHRQRASGGGAKRKLSAAQEVLLVLSVLAP